MVALLPLFFLATFSLISTRDSLQRATSANLFTVAELVEQGVKLRLAETYAKVSYLAQDPIVAGAQVSQDEKEAELLREQQSSLFLDDITLIDAQGKVVASANYRFRGDWAAKPWVQEALRGKPTFSDAHIIPDPTQVVIVVASPVRDAAGKVVGVLTGQMDMEQIWQVTDDVKVGQSGYVVVYNRRGDIIAHPDQERLWEKFPQSLDGISGPEPQNLHYFSDRGASLVTSDVPVLGVEPWGDIGWRVVAVQPQAEAFALMNTTISQALLALALALVIIVLAALTFARYITRPVSALVTATRLLARGELGYRVALERGDELGQLASSFNEMSTTIAQQRANLEETYQATLGAVATALDLRDHETESHARRVTLLATAMAQRLGLTGEGLISLQRGAFLHDVGKIGVPDAVLLKPGPLTDREWAEMKRHPEHGYRMLMRVAFLAGALPVILHHHEHWDGSGYPDGLAGEAIPLGARIFAVADAYDAITSDRPYRRARPTEVAVVEILAEGGKQFDPRVVAAFEDAMRSAELVTAIAALTDEEEAGAAGVSFPSPPPSPQGRG